MLRTLVNSALRLDPHEVAPSDDIESRLIGDAPVMHDLRTRIRKLARSQAPVYISGESGVGKELVAQMIHANGPRSGARFVPVNCGAISRDLIESELFGHKKGSFTGAFADNLGLFQAANGGTLFLDEVAELPLPMQVKLLRAIQEKAVRPVGSNTEIPIDVRILSATHKDLGGLVQAEQFRQDLFYRVNVIELKVPPLRERSHDVERLAKYILGRTSDLEVTPELAPSALKALREYEFPGNVRELENVLERALTLCEGNVIDAFDLALPSTLKANSQVTGMAFGRETLDDYLAQVEIETIESAMFKADNNKTAAAGMLGLKLGALRYRMQKLSLE